MGKPGRPCIKKRDQSDEDLLSMLRSKKRKLPESKRITFQVTEENYKGNRHVEDSFDLNLEYDINDGKDSLKFMKKFFDLLCSKIG